MPQLQYSVYEHVFPVHQELFLKLGHFTDILPVFDVLGSLLLYVGECALVHFDETLLLDLPQIFHYGKRLAAYREVCRDLAYRDPHDLSVCDADLRFSLKLVFQLLL